jgi:S1-C subfamily serine protease
MKKRITLVFLAACVASPMVFADVSESYLQSLDLKRVGKPSVEQVEVFLSDQNPSRPHVVVGNYTVESDGDQNSERLMEIARKKAATLGADFIKIKQASARTKITKSVGGVAFIGIGLKSETDAKSIPKIVFTIGAYNKSSLGLIFDPEALKGNRFVVSGFRSYSLAEKNGTQTGDEILELNGMLMADKRLQPIMLDAEPGSVMKLYVKRSGNSLTLDVPTAPVM